MWLAARARLRQTALAHAGQTHLVPPLESRANPPLGIEIPDGLLTVKVPVEINVPSHNVGPPETVSPPAPETVVPLKVVNPEVVKFPVKLDPVIGLITSEFEPLVRFMFDVPIVQMLDPFVNVVVPPVLVKLLPVNSTEPETLNPKGPARIPPLGTARLLTVRALKEVGPETVRLFNKEEPETLNPPVTLEPIVDCTLIEFGPEIKSIPALA